MNLETLPSRNSEPIAIYMDRLQTYRENMTVDEATRVAAQERVLAYVDENLAGTYTAVLSHIQAEPGVPDIRAANWVVRYLVSHPQLSQEQRQALSDSFNTVLQIRGLDRIKDAVREIPPIAMPEVTLDLSLTSS